ncbi:S8 family serine peptidase [Polyangium sorediatum]|uniref:S8 family serine peptidase n=1 Tax=Polyangium sorediatum TaxID=889274 RepID=A0ABT6PAT3_9BACT|nr:S8 family serine peptidase [Polyangium sorediatum]MDI1437643.1 S8 family serine peptidase [Polyangium sorediatum]
MAPRIQHARTTLPLLATLLAAPLAHAAPPPEASTFLDGGQAVTAERLGAAALDPRGRSLKPVRLRYGSRSFLASIDHTAVVRLDPGGEEALARRGYRLVEPLMPSIGLFLVEDTAGEDGLSIAARLARPDARTEGVRDAVPNLYVRMERRGAPFTPNDPRFSGQWYFGDESMRMSEAWGITQGDAATTVVVIDSGCDLTHPDLQGKLDPGVDVVDGDDDPSYDPAFSGAEHGTACAGIIGAATNNGVGIAGACPECRLRCVRMLADEATPLSAPIKAFDFALQTGAAVVSNSWGYVEAMPVPAALRDAIDNVFDNGRGGKGAVVVFAAGNDNRKLGDDELNAVRGVLTIGAINQFDDKTFFTNFGASLDLVAPIGTLTTDIVGPGGLDPTDYTLNFGGTSSACPVAAGVAALVASAAPELSSAEIVDLLVETARPAPYATPDAAGHDVVFGHGIVDPVAALTAALGDVEPPVTTPNPPAETEEDAGCACRAGRAGGDTWMAGAFYGALLAGLSLRRRARR